MMVFLSTEVKYRIKVKGLQAINSVLLNINGLVVVLDF